jgi:DNA-binding response OmpR family regulator
MPGLDGLGLAAKVKVARPDLPVLMISGYGGHDLSRRGLVASADRFLTKPFSRNDVLTRVRKLLDGCDRNP